VDSRSKDFRSKNSRTADLPDIDPGEMDDLIANLDGDPIVSREESCPDMPEQVEQLSELTVGDNPAFAADAISESDDVSSLHADVVIVFEMSKLQYEEAKKHFDHLITTHALSHRIKIDNEVF